MSTIDIRQHLKGQELEHCCICGKALVPGKDEILIDENDDVWCAECNEEFALRMDAIYEDMKKRKKK